jgi:hypothetical protein
VAARSARPQVAGTWSAARPAVLVGPPLPETRIALLAGIDQLLIDLR